MGPRVCSNIVTAGRIGKGSMAVHARWPKADMPTFKNIGASAMIRSIAVSGFLLMSAAACFAQTAADWTPYRDESFGFSAELPLGLFEAVEAEGSPGLVLAETGGEAVIKLYGGPADGLTRDTLEARLASGEQVGTITYRAGGDTWFVLSGFYEPLGPGDLTIFYDKVMFSADRQTFSAFEISFPADDKPRLEDLVERFEDNFTRPR
jgi:hypothetical protein